MPSFEKSQGGIQTPSHIYAFQRKAAGGILVESKPEKQELQTHVCGGQQARQLFWIAKMGMQSTGTDM